MTKTKRSPGMPRRTQQTASNSNRTRWILIAGAVGVVAVAAVVAIVLGLGGSSGPPEPATQPLDITGQPLPELPAEGADPAVGTALPSMAGTGLDGQPLEIGPQGGAQMVVALAHWCPHCQAELPMLVDMINSGDIPDGVSVVGLATAIDDLRPNYPPSAWFEREGWTQPTLIDDANSSGLHALGFSVFPGFVFVNAQGQVTQRVTGEVDRQVLIQALDALGGG